MGKLRSDFAHDLLLQVAGVGGEAHVGGLWAIQGWMIAESGSEPCTGITGISGQGAAANPLNTTLKQAGSKPYNTAGVQSYVSYEDGIAATAETLTNSRYAKIIAAMKAKGDPEVVARDILWEVTGSPWGTEGRVLYAGLADFVNDRKRYNHIPVGP